MIFSNISNILQRIEPPYFNSIGALLCVGAALAITLTHWLPKPFLSSKFSANGQFMLPERRAVWTWFLTLSRTANVDYKGKFLIHTYLHVTNKMLGVERKAYSCSQAFLGNTGQEAQVWVKRAENSGYLQHQASKSNRIQLLHNQLTRRQSAWNLELPDSGSQSMPGSQ